MYTEIEEKCTVSLMVVAVLSLASRKPPARRKLAAACALLPKVWKTDALTVYVAWRPGGINPGSSEV